MSEQLVIHIDSARAGYRWCYLDEQGQRLPNSDTRGDAQSLADALPPGPNPAWLIVSGARVVTRHASYKQAEKKHLQRLLPYQLEETLIGDVERFHFALGPSGDGIAALAYVERAWLRQVYDELQELGVEITHCWPAPLLLPYPEQDSDSDDGAVDGWVLRADGDTVWVRHAEHLGFSIALEQLPLALKLLLNERAGTDHPRLHLQAADQAELEALERALPTPLDECIAHREVSDFWALDFARTTTDLAQGEFSQRLPIERWWRHWRATSAFAAACLVAYIGVLLFQTHTLDREQLQIRQQTEEVFRTVVPSGPAQDPERRLSILARELQPGGESGMAMEILGDFLPAVDEAGQVELRNIQYTASRGEINANIQAGSFNAIEELREGIGRRGLNAELVSASAQGDSHSARLRITRAGS